jgi:hypothetical protein
LTIPASEKYCTFGLGFPTPIVSMFARI